MEVEIGNQRGPLGKDRERNTNLFNMMKIVREDLALKLPVFHRNAKEDP